MKIYFRLVEVQLSYYITQFLIKVLKRAFYLKKGQEQGR